MNFLFHFLFEDSISFLHIFLTDYFFFFCQRINFLCSLFFFVFYLDAMRTLFYCFFFFCSKIFYIIKIKREKKKKKIDRKKLSVLHNYKIATSQMNNENESTMR